MGTTHQLTDHRSFSRVALTLLAVLSLIATQMVGFSATPAGANDDPEPGDLLPVGGGANFYYYGYLELSNGTRLELGNPSFDGSGDLIEPFDGQSQDDWDGPLGQNVQIYGYEWQGEQKPNFHLSCSQQITGTQVRVVHTDPNVTVEIEDYVIYQVHRNGFSGGQLVKAPTEPECSDLTFVDLQIEKTALLDGSEITTVQTGTEFQYRLTAWNAATGEHADPALDVTITDVIDSAFEYVSNDSGCTYDEGTATLTCDVGTLPHSGSATSGAFTVDVTVRAPGDTDDCAAVPNVAIVDASNAAPDQDDATVTVLCPSTGSITLEKLDEDENSLSGATLALYAGNVEAVDGLEDLELLDVAGNPCVTGTDSCVFDDLELGYYTAVEVAAPDGYRLSDSTPQVDELTEDNADAGITFAFENPRIPYRISVEQDDVNPVGDPHTFTVLLEHAPDTDGDWEPLGGETVDLSFDTYPGFDDGGDIVSIDASGAGTDTCVTASEGSELALGTCLVTVNSGSPAKGELNATYTTPYQHETSTEASSDTTVGADGVPGAIADSATKEWRGLNVTIGDDGENLVGEEHPFDVLVTDSDGDPIAGATVTVEWDGPVGSTLDGIAVGAAGDPVEGTCVTAGEPVDEGDPAEGTCRFLVNHDEVSTGEITVTEVEADVDGKPLVVPSDGDEASGKLALTFGDNDVLSATKDWVDFRVEISPNATNYIDWEHPFTITVYKLTPGGPEGGTTVSGAKVFGDWTTDAGDNAIIASDQLDGDPTEGVCVTDGDGECTISVEATSGTVPSAGTLSVTSIGDVEVDGEARTSVTVAEATATKTWVDYGIDVRNDGVNPLGTADDSDSEHEFRLHVTRSASDLGDDLSGIELDVVWQGVGGIIGADELKAGTLAADGSSVTCITDEDGLCTVTVDSDDEGSGTLIVTELRDPAVTDANNPDGVVLEVTSDDDLDGFECPAEGDDPRVCGNKTWVEFGLTVTPDVDTNHVDVDHPFEVELTGNLDGVTVTGFTYAWDGSLADPTVVSDTCTSPGTTNPCTITVSATTAGDLRLTVTSATITLDGETYTLNFGSGAELGQDVAFNQADKFYVEYLVEFEPPATNLLGDDHTFEVMVSRIIGYDGDDAITEPAEDVTITLCWDGTLGSALEDADADGCVTVTTGTDEEAGVATVTVLSPDAPTSGQLTIASLTSDAGVELPTDGVTTFQYVDDRDAADKSWVAFRVIVTPDEATNLADDGLNEGRSEHVFIVTVESAPDPTLGPIGDPDDATQWHWAPFAGATIDVLDSDQVEWDLPAGWNLGDILVDDTCDAGTLANGTCTITVDSTQAGTASLEVVAIGVPGDAVDSEDDTVVIGAAEGLITSYTATIDDAEVTFDSSGAKTWAQYEVDIYADAVNLVGDDHTFYIQVTRDTGDGASGIDGVDVQPTWVFEDADPETLPTCTTDSWSEVSSEARSHGTDDDGWCAVTVSDDGPGEGTLSVDALTHAVDPAEAAFTFDVAEAAAAKTWIEFDVEVSPDATNNLGVDHDFLVTVRLDDGSGLERVNGATVKGTFAWDTPDLTDEAVECTTAVADGVDGTCVITIDAPADGEDDIPGKGTLTLTDLSYTYEKYGESGDDAWPFTIDLTDASGDGLVSGFTTPTSTKVWASYQLLITPPTDTNLLPGNESHLFTVHLSSDDTDALAIDGQQLDLELDSSVVEEIHVTDADEVDREVIVDDSGTTTFTCTTFGADDEGFAPGTCEVTVTTGGAGSATLTANFSTLIQGETFSADQAQGDKTWTTYQVRIENTPAVNLLGTPHVFDVYVENTVDGVTWTGVEAAAADLDISISGDATIETTDRADDCANGADEDGFCTVTVDSTSTGIFLLSVTYNAENESVTGTQTGAFSDTGSKQWIDFDVTVTPDTAENLVDTEHVFEVLVEADFGEGFGPVDGAVPTIGLEGVGHIVPSTGELPDCAEGTDEDGLCTVTITSSTPGTSTVTATYEGSTALAFTEGTVGDPETADYSDTGDKLWVDYDLELTPPEAVNALDDPHTYTVTLQRDEGEGPFPAAGELVTIGIDGVGTITDIDDGEVAGDEVSGTCTTDVDGSCEITVVSGEAGTTNLTASFDAVVGETQGTFGAEAVKHWIAIDITKEAIAEVGDDLIVGELIEFEGEKVLLIDLEETDTYDVDYGFVVTNPSDRDLDVTSLVDRFFDRDHEGVNQVGEQDLLAAFVAANGGSSILAAGGSVAFTMTLTLDGDDIERGFVDNTVTVIAEDLEYDESVSDSDDEVIDLVEVEPAVLEPGISIVKSVTSGVVDSDGRLVVQLRGADATQVVGYAYLITNTGDEDLTDLTLVDDKIGDLTDAFTTAVVAAYGEAVLPVDGAVTVTATHEVDSSDFTGDALTNVATVEGTGVDSDTTVTDDDDETVGLVEVLEVVKTLPKTGADSTLLTLWGLVLAAIGAAVLLFTPRRRRAEA